MVEKYGVSSPMHIPGVLEKMENTNLEKYGVKYYVNHIECTAKNYSSIHKKVYEYLVSLKYDCINEYNIGDGKYLYDIYIESLNSLIEVNGDYWHANPTIYESNFEIRSGLYARDKWEYDKNKITLAVNKKYNVLVLWENQINDDSYINIINKYIKEK